MHDKLRIRRPLVCYRIQENHSRSKSYKLDALPPRGADLENQRVGGSVSEVQVPTRSCFNTMFSLAHCALMMNSVDFRDARADSSTRL